MDSDYDQPTIPVRLGPGTDVAERPQPVDARVRPEVDEDDFPAQVSDIEGCCVGSDEREPPSARAPRRTPEALDLEEAEVAAYFQPYPDRLLEPDLAVEERESVGLAFVGAMQFLPPRQRAVLVLREVLGWPAREVADLLDDSVASVNSALQRARATLERERSAGRLARDHVPTSSDAESRAVSRFVAAWEAVDVDGILELLSDDAVMTMPPDPMRLLGTDAIGVFFRTVPAGGALERIRLVPTRANGQPAVAAYLEDDEGFFDVYGVMVLALAGEDVASITGFAGYPELFPRLGLPLRLEA